jgi:hypothetical protein
MTSMPTFWLLSNGASMAAVSDPSDPSTNSLTGPTRRKAPPNPDVTPVAIKEAVSQIPTLFKIKTPCHGALLLKAARKVVEQSRHRIVNFIEAHQ